MKEYAKVLALVKTPNVNASNVNSMSTKYINAATSATDEYIKAVCMELANLIKLMPSYGGKKWGYSSYREPIQIREGLMFQTIKEWFTI